MSGKFINGTTPELIRQMNELWGNPQHTIVNVQGLTGGDGARIQNSAEVEKWALGTGKLVNVGNWFASLNGRTIETPLVQQLSDFINEVFDPRGKLILTGKSRGGLNILQLCQWLNRNAPFYKLSRITENIGDNKRKGGFHFNDGSPYVVAVQVDALYVMDATFDADAMMETQRRVPGLVRNYVNYFQRKEDNNGKHGQLVAESTATLRQENDWTERIPRFRIESAHDYLVNRLAQPDVDVRVNADLNKPADPIPVPLGPPRPLSFGKQSVAPPIRSFGKARR